MIGVRTNGSKSMVKNSEKTADNIDFDRIQKPLWVVLSLRDLYDWLNECLGPMATEVLSIYADCVFDEDPVDARAPEAFRRLHRTLCGQGLDRFEAERVMREGYGKLLAYLDEMLPGWSSHVHYHGLEHSMRGSMHLMLVFRPELPRQKHVL